MPLDTAAPLSYYEGWCFHFKWNSCSATASLVSHGDILDLSERLDKTLLIPQMGNSRVTRVIDRGKRVTVIEL